MVFKKIIYYCIFNLFSISSFTTLNYYQLLLINKTYNRNLRRQLVKSFKKISKKGKKVLVKKEIVNNLYNKKKQDLLFVIKPISIDYSLISLFLQKIFISKKKNILTIDVKGLSLSPLYYQQIFFNNLYKIKNTWYLIPYIIKPFYGSFLGFDRQIFLSDCSWINTVITPSYSIWWFMYSSSLVIPKLFEESFIIQFSEKTPNIHWCWSYAILRIKIKRLNLRLSLKVKKVKSLAFENKEIQELSDCFNKKKKEKQLKLNGIELYSNVLIYKKLHHLKVNLIKFLINTINLLKLKTKLDVLSKEIYVDIDESKFNKHIMRYIFIFRLTLVLNYIFIPKSKYVLQKQNFTNKLLLQSNKVKSYFKKSLGWWNAYVLAFKDMYFYRLSKDFHIAEYLRHKFKFQLLHQFMYKSFGSKEKKKLSEYLYSLNIVKNKSPWNTRRIKMSKPTRKLAIEDYVLSLIASCCVKPVFSNEMDYVLDKALCIWDNYKNKLLSSGYIDNMFLRVSRRSQNRRFKKSLRFKISPNTMYPIWLKKYWKRLSIVFHKLNIGLGTTEFNRFINLLQSRTHSWFYKALTFLESQTKVFKRTVVKINKKIRFKKKYKFSMKIGRRINVESELALDNYFISNTGNNIVSKKVINIFVDPSTILNLSSYFCWIKKKVLFQPHPQLNYLKFNLVNNLFHFFIYQASLNLLDLVFFNKKSYDKSITLLIYDRLNEWLDLRPSIIMWLDSKNFNFIKEFYWLNSFEYIRPDNVSDLSSRWEQTLDNKFFEYSDSYNLLSDNDLEEIEISDFDDSLKNNEFTINTSEEVDCYFFNFYKKRLSTYRDARKLHWTLFTYKTLREYRYKLFLKKCLKNTQFSTLSHIFYLLNLGFELPWGAWSSLIKNLKYISNFLFIKKLKIYTLPFSLKLWRSLVFFKLHQLKLIAKVKRWAAIQQRTKFKYWMDKKLGSPKFFNQMNTKFRKFSYFVHLDFITSSFVILKEEFFKLNFQGKYKIIHDNLVLKLLNYRYRA